MPFLMIRNDITKVAADAIVILFGCLQKQLITLYLM